DRGEAGAVRRERPALHRRGRDPGALVGLGGRGRRRARPRSGRVRLPGDPGGAPGPSGPARPGRPCLRGRPGGEGARARAGRAPGGRPRARRRPARERAGARGHDRRDHPREPALPHGRRPAAHRPEVTELRVIPVEGIPEVRAGDDLAALLAAASTLEDGDVLVVAQKAVCKAEGRVVSLDGVVSDSCGRAWRQGTTDVAIGVAGRRPLLDLRGVRDATGYELHATTIAVADEIAGAVELVMGKTSGVPAAIVRGLEVAGQ